MWIPLSWWCSCLLCAVRWVSHTASSRARPDWANWCTERPAPLLPSHRPTPKTKQLLLSWWRPSRPTTMTDMRRSVVTGEAMSWVPSQLLALLNLRRQRPRSWLLNWVEFLSCLINNDPTKWLEFHWFFFFLLFIISQYMQLENRFFFFFLHVQNLQFFFLYFHI